MKYFFGLLFLLSNCGYAQKLAYLEEFGSKTYFEPPDSSVWILDENEMTEYGTHILMFKHVPINDSLGRIVQPVLSLIIESVKDSSDVVTFSIEKMVDAHYKIKTLKDLMYKDGYFSQRNSIGYLGQYQREDVIHTIYFCCIRNSDIGVTIICDSTDELFEKVREDMLRFIKSVGINE